VKFIYISSPYRADTPEDTEQNKQVALAACEEAYRFGLLTGNKIIPLTPITNFPYLNNDKPEEREQAFRMGITLMSNCDELWIAGDRISEGMRSEIRAAHRLGKPVYSMGMEQERIQDVIADMRPMLDEKVCFKHSNEKNFKDQLLVLKASTLASWALEPENQLWIAKHGFGTSPTARGRAVYCENLFDGEEARFNRTDFCGVAIYTRLPDWARERFEEYQKQQQDQQEQQNQDNQDNDESEELEL
jgi:hypothetical protein